MKKNYSFIISLIFLLVMTKSANGQKLDYKMMSIEPSSNYYEIINQQREYFKSLKAQGIWYKKQIKAQKQFERWAYIWKDRINQDGSFPSKNQIVKSEYMKLLKNTMYTSKKSTETVDWEQVGPLVNVVQNGYDAYPGMGRVNVVAMDPVNNQIMYAGPAAGGVWKTTDGGNSWIPKTDNLAGLGVSDIIVDPNNTNIIYVATGEKDGWNISSIGLFKSVDGGETWNITGLSFTLNENEYIRDIAFAPGNSQRIFALTNVEIKYSNDAGITWNNATVTYPYQPFMELFQTIIFDPNDSNKVIVSDYWGGLYVSTDGGNDFDMHDVFQGGNNSNVLKLIATPNDNDFFYAMSQDGNFMKFRFNIDNTANDKVSSTVIDGYNPQGGYNVCIAVSPTDKDKIMIGGVRGYKSTDNGQNFSVMLNPYNDPPGVGFYVHPDHHFLTFLSDGTTVVDGHDGGVHIGGFNAAAWNDISNGLVITQSYNIAITQASNGDDFMMANQDNDGFSKVIKDGVQQWVACLAGDGTATGIDYSNVAIRYLGGTGGSLYRSDNGYSQSYLPTTQLLQGDNNAAFVSPMAIHPVTPTTIYAGDNDVKKSTNKGDNFVTLNSGLSGTSFLDVTPYNGSTHIYAIGENGVKRSDNDGVTWHDINAPAGLTINSLAAIPNSNTVFATVSSYSNGNKVFRSVDGGVTWSNISDGLPNIIMKKLVYKTNLANEALFLGTELGVYYKNQEMGSWIKYGNGLPNVIVNDLKINYTDELLYVGTYGRGMWRIDVSDEALGIKNIAFDSNEKPNIYPNPVTNNNLFVEIPDSISSQAPISYIIYNIVGGIISNGNLDVGKNIINLNNPSKGIYLLKVTVLNKSITSKIIVE